MKTVLWIALATLASLGITGCITDNSDSYSRATGHQPLPDQGGHWGQAKWSCQYIGDGGQTYYGEGHIKGEAMQRAEYQCHRKRKQSCRLSTCHLR